MFLSYIVSLHILFESIFCCCSCRPTNQPRMNHSHSCRIQKAASKLVAEEDVWSKYNIPTIPVECVIRHLYNPMTETWHTDEAIVKMEAQPFTHGAMRHCYRLKKWPPHLRHVPIIHFHGWSRSSNYVAKAYVVPDPDCPERRLIVDCSDEAQQAVQNDVLLQYEAMHWANQFNDLRPPRTIIFLRAYAMVGVGDVLHLGDGGDNLMGDNEKDGKNHTNEATAKRSNVTPIPDVSSSSTTAASNVQSTVRKSMQLRSSMLPSNSSKRKPSFHRTKSDVDEVTSSLYRATIDTVFDHKVFLLCSCRLLCCCFIVVLFVVVVLFGWNNESRRRCKMESENRSPLGSD